ncbi:MAG: serine/threonine-protein kinase [Planctomycetota bacterium]
MAHETSGRSGEPLPFSTLEGSLPLSAGAPEAVDDLLDRLVSEYTDRRLAGDQPDHAVFLGQVPPGARPGLERCLKIVDAGEGQSRRSSVGPGTRLGRFEIQRELGRGGMAVVYLATDPDLRRPVALKVLRAGLALDASHVDRFEREGRAIAKLSHPGVVQVYEVGESDGLHWIAMEYVAGPSLRTVIEAIHGDGAPSAEKLARAVGDLSLASSPTLGAAAAQLLRGPAAGLVAAHAAGLIHRDIKPSNILVRADGSAVLADFGLARSQGDPGLSLTGAPIGTPYYMAPEQAHTASHTVDERTDVYGLGVTLFELISGQRPYAEETLLEVLDAIRFRSPRALRGLSAWATDDDDAVVRMAMKREAEERYATSEAMRATAVLMS